MSLRKDSEVWVPNRDFSWLPAEVIEPSDKQVCVVRIDQLNKNFLSGIHCYAKTVRNDNSNRLGSSWKFSLIHR
ncbi:hypothetical protein RYX36_012464, partial [Vicia faba]